MIILAIEFSFSTLFRVAPLGFWASFKLLCIITEFYVAKDGGNAVYFPQVMLLEVASLIMTGWCAVVA